MISANTGTAWTLALCSISNHFLSGLWGFKKKQPNDVGEGVGRGAPKWGKNQLLLYDEDKWLYCCVCVCMCWGGEAKSGWDAHSEFLISQARQNPSTAFAPRRPLHSSSFGPIQSSCQPWSLKQSFTPLSFCISFSPASARPLSAGRAPPVASS